MNFSLIPDYMSGKVSLEKTRDTFKWETSDWKRPSAYGLGMSEAEFAQARTEGGLEQIAEARRASFALGKEEVERLMPGVSFVTQDDGVTIKKIVVAGEDSMGEFYSQEVLSMLCFNDHRFSADMEIVIHEAHTIVGYLKKSGKRRAK